MNVEQFLEHLNSGSCVSAGSEAHLFMCFLSNEAMKITTVLNSNYHTPSEVRALFGELIGRPVDDDFTLFPPFYTDCGKNIGLGAGVFINSNCNFQDQGGITIGDYSLIGHKVTLTTLNHGIESDDRGTLYPSPITIGANVWIGAGATVLPGITIGKGAIVGAGAVVTRDVAPLTVVAGNPARVIKQIK